MPQEPPGKGMLLIPDFSRDQNLSAPSQAIVVCPVSTVPGARAAVYLGQECSSIRASTSPALQSDPWRISIAPVTSSPPKPRRTLRCLFACLFWQEEKGPNGSLGKCIMHPSSGIVAPAGKAVPYFLPVPVSEVDNAGKALGQRKAAATYGALLLRSPTAWLLGSASGQRQLQQS